MIATTSAEVGPGKVRGRFHVGSSVPSLAWQVLETSRACRALAAPLLESQAQAGADGGTTPGVAPVCLGAVRAGLVEAALKACDVLQERTQGLPEDHVDGSSTLDSGLRTALELLVCSLAGKHHE